MAEEKAMLHQISRTEAINALRRAYAKRLDADTSMCRYAAEHGVFCGGFRRFGDGELRRRFPWIWAKDPQMPREELEELGNRWQLARQEVGDAPIACDVQTEEHDLCNGWDDFSNDQLANFYEEAFKKAVVVQ
jgi:hypothetical protein